MMLKEIKKYMNDGFQLESYARWKMEALCQSLGIDPIEFEKNPDFII